jgi:hypothetical protein
MKSISLFLFGLILPAFVSAQRYLFYLHGRIIEEQGIHAVDTVNGYGAYKYEEILDAFKKADFIVLSEARPKNTNPFDYAHKIKNQVDSLIKKGVKSNYITIVGASKGAIISMFISTYLKNQHVNFVFMGGCDDEILERFSEIQFCGNILSIYEKTDEEGSCIKFRQRTNLSVPHYKEIELNTGLKHGYLYKPLVEWINPVIKWGKGKYNQETY